MKATSAMMWVVIGVCIITLMVLVFMPVKRIDVFQDFTKDDWLVCCYDRVYGKHDYVVTEWRHEKDCAPTSTQEYPVVITNSQYRFAVEQTKNITTYDGKPMHVVNCGAVAVEFNGQIIRADTPEEIYKRIDSKWKNKSYPG